MSDTNNAVWFHRSGVQYGGSFKLALDAKRGAATYDYVSKCARCGGLGGGSQWEHTGWVCYECSGSGKGPVRTEHLYTAERLAKLNAAQGKRDAAKVAKQQAKDEAARIAANEARKAFVAANGEVVARLQGYVASCEEGEVSSPDTFLLDLYSKFEKYGSLSPAQITAIQNNFARMEERAARTHVGSIGERAEFTLMCERVIHLEQTGRFAAPSIYICRDAAGNKVVYKGTGSFLHSGETGVVKATVEEHGEFRGERQTNIARPKLVKITASPNDWRLTA